jgi:hypothetical protein
MVNRSGQNVKTSTYFGPCLKNGWPRRHSTDSFEHKRLFGFALGAAAGAISGALRDVGIDDNFMKSLGETLRPDSAALCVLIWQMTADKVLEEIQRFGGTLIKTNLCHENEAKLRDALASAQKAAGALAMFSPRWLLSIPAALSTTETRLC